MKITAKHFAKLLFEITKDEQDVEIATARFIEFLKKHKSIRLFPKITHEFVKYFNQEHAIQPVIVYFSSAKEPSVLTHMKNFLKAEIETAEVELITETETKLLGGLKFRIDDLIIDASIQNKVNKLRQGLIS